MEAVDESTNLLQKAWATTEVRQSLLTDPSSLLDKVAGVVPAASRRPTLAPQSESPVGRSNWAMSLPRILLFPLKAAEVAATLLSTVR